MLLRPFTNPANEKPHMNDDYRIIKDQFEAFRISVRDAIEPIGNHVTLEKYGDRFAELKLTAQQLHAIHTIYRSLI